jgi:glycosyltransferase involved in cell wall biosynthesis
MLWIDVTDTFLKWSGSPNGIQRTLLGLAETAKTRDDVSLCVHDRKRQLWRKISPKTFEEVFESVPRDGNVRIAGFGKDLLMFSIAGALSVAKARLEPDRMLKECQRSLASIDLLRTMPEKFKTFRNTSHHSSWISVERVRMLTSLSPVAFRAGHDTVLFADSHWNKRGILRSLAAQPNKPYIVGFCHDVIPLERPDFVAPRASEDLRQWIEEMQQHCDQILCNSSHSASRLAANFSQVAPRPSVRAIKFGNAINTFTPASQDALRLDELCLRQPAEALSISQRASEASSWYLWVGSLDIRKNIDVLLLAVEGLARRGLMMRPLVVVGRRSTGSAYYRHKIERNPILREWVVHVEAAPDELLYTLQRQAALFLFTSWEEGYGLPVAEALQAGIPVIASNATSIPEVAGDLVDYFEPWNSGQLAALIERFETDPAYRADLKARAARFVPTDWNETIDDIISGLPAGAA